MTNNQKKNNQNGQHKYQHHTGGGYIFTGG